MNPCTDLASSQFPLPSRERARGKRENTVKGEDTTRKIKLCACTSRICLLALFMIGSILSTQPGFALDASERAFIWNEAHARMAGARTPDAYLRAAQTYQKLVDDGVRNGPLFYNLGTALLQAGQINPAIDAFLRAEQFLGAQNDIHQNLKIAMARKANNEMAEWPWYRLVLCWHFYLSAATRMMVAALAFFIFWAALTLRLLGIQRSGVNIALILAAITMILFGSSVATAWQQETTAPALPLTQLSTPR